MTRLRAFTTSLGFLSAGVSPACSITLQKAFVNRNHLEKKMASGPMIDLRFFCRRELYMNEFGIHFHI